MKINKWHALRDAQSVLDAMGIPAGTPWAVVGSALTAHNPHDVDVMVMRPGVDCLVWIAGWDIPFDLFHFVPASEAEKAACFSECWRGDTENITAPVATIRRIKNH